MSNYTIRKATVDDADKLLEIYAPYVDNTAITFEYEVPTIEEFRNRISNISKKYPYIVLEDLDGIAGYAYCGAFKERAAYDWAVETTIYLKESKKGLGYGKALYKKLEDILKKQNIINMNACIATCEIEDEHLTNASMRFHDRMGYRLVGEFLKCGFKFGTWYNMVWMEKMIGEHTDNPKSVIPFCEIESID